MYTLIKDKVMNMEIKISEIEIIPVKPNNGLVAFSSCIFNEQLYLGEIAIHSLLDGSGYRLVYPAKNFTNGKALNIFYPINRVTGDVIQKAITDEYRKLILKINQQKMW